MRVCEPNGEIPSGAVHFNDSKNLSVFLNGQELRSLDAPVRLGENDALTFVRLTMLSGNSWHF